MENIAPSSRGRVFAEIPQLRSNHCKTEFDIICRKLIFPAKALFIWSGLAHLSGLPHLGGMFLSFRSYDIFYPT